MTQPLLLEEESVRAAIDAFFNDRALPENSPLWYLLCMQSPQRRSASGSLLSLPSLGGIGAETLIFNMLYRMMRHLLDRQRRLHGFPSVNPHADKTQVATDLELDFSSTSKELRSISYLYHRVARSDLDLSVEEFEAFTGEPRRTLQRRQVLGIRRLTQMIVRREAALRQKNRQAMMITRLGAPLTLIARGDLVGQVMSVLTVDPLPRHVLLYGPSGIGKTALALAAAHHWIAHTANLATADVIWVEHTPDTVAETLQYVLRQLGYPSTQPDQSDLPPLPATTLIILDDAQSLLSCNDVAVLLRYLSQVQVILCAQVPFRALPIHHLVVPELDKSAAIDLLVSLSELLGFDSYSPDQLDYFDSLYRSLGGNAGALRNALTMESVYDPSFVSGLIYQPVWESATLPMRLVWQTLSLSPRGTLDLTSLLRTLTDTQTDTLADQLSPDKCRTALAHLHQSGVVESVKTNIKLAAAAYTFGVKQLTSEAQIAAQAAQSIARDISTTPDMMRCLALIEHIQSATFSPSLQLDVAYTNVALIERAGAWSAWVRYLEWVRSTAVPRLMGPDQLEHRLWLGIHIGIACRWLARWNVAAYALADVISDAGMAGRFETQAEAMIELAAVYRPLHILNRAMELATKAYTLYRKYKNTDGMIRAAAEQGRIALTGNDLTKVTTILHDLELHLDSTASSLHEGTVYSLRAQRDFSAGNLESALKVARRAQQAQAGDLPRTGRTLALLGQLYHQAGERAAAIDHFTSAMNLMEQTGDQFGYARARMNLASVYIGAGNFRTALAYLRDLPDRFAQNQDDESLQVAIANLDMLTRISRQWKSNRRTGKSA